MSDLDKMSDRQWEEYLRQKDRAWAHALRRDSMAENGLKALLVLNGGGAVALLAFLQAIWVNSVMSDLLQWIVWALACVVVGAAIAGAVHFLRYMTSMTYQTDSQEKGRKMTKLHGWVTVCSFVFFLLGMGIIVTGALRNLP